MRKARIFSNIFRLVDYLCTFDNYEFENNYKNIFTDQLELKKENENPCETSVLHLSIDVQYRKFTTKFLEKRDVFSFMHYLDSTIPSKIFFQDNSRTY